MCTYTHAHTHTKCINIYLFIRETLWWAAQKGSRRCTGARTHTHTFINTFVYIHFCRGKKIRADLCPERHIRVRAAVTACPALLLPQLLSELFCLFSVHVFRVSREQHAGAYFRRLVPEEYVYKVKTVIKTVSATMYTHTHTHTHTHTRTHTHARTLVLEKHFVKSQKIYFLYLVNLVASLLLNSCTCPFSLPACRLPPSPPPAGALRLACSC